MGIMNDSFGDQCVKRLSDAIASSWPRPEDANRLAALIDELVKTRVSEMMQVHLTGERNRLAALAEPARQA